MPKITVIYPNGDEKDIDAPVGLSVMEIAQKNDVEEIEGACGNISEEEEDMLDLAFDIREKSRLSCQIQMTDELDGLVVALPGAKVDWAD